MFSGARKFNQDLSKWDVGKGHDFARMFAEFEGAPVDFNQDLSGWNVGSGRYFDSMFYGASNFNQDLSGWDVGSGRYFRSMFSGARKFNQDLSGWDVESGYNRNARLGGNNRVAVFASMVGIGTFETEDYAWNQLNNFLPTDVNKALNKCERKLTASKTCPKAIFKRCEKKLSASKTCPTARQSR